MVQKEKASHQYNTEMSLLLERQEIDVGHNKIYPVYSFNQYLEKASNGLCRIQYYSIFLVFIIKLSAYFITMNIGFMKMFPDFLCQYSDSSIFQTCQPKQFCNYITEEPYADVKVQADWTSENTIDNVITRFLLYCSSSTFIMMIGESIKLGMIIYLVFFSQIFNTIGRKTVIIWSLAVQLTCLLLMIVCTEQVYFMYLLLFTLGAALGLLQFQAWIYFIEFMPIGQHSLIILLSNAGRAAGLIVGSLFFYSVSHKQDHFLMLNIGLSFVVLVMIVAIYPESPKYFYMMTKYSKARSILNEISMKYKGEKTIAIFREETSDPRIVITEEYLERDSNQESDTKKLMQNQDEKGIFSRRHFVKALIRDKTFRINFFAIISCHNLSSFIFDLVMLVLPRLSGNIYLNSISVGICELIAYCTSGLLMKWLGTKRQIFSCYLISCLLSIVFLLQGNMSVQTQAFYLGVIMFGVAANNNTTIYAGYACSPQELVTTFFTAQNVMKIVMLTASPILAEAHIRTIQWFFILSTGVCALLSLFIDIEKEVIINAIH